ncbi:RNA polymerase factor sigma-32 [Bradyrhizobium diazoefficiens]
MSPATLLSPKPPIEPPILQNNASAYITSVSRYPVLERNLEEDLARRWVEHRDKVAGELLVTSHMRLAAKIARRYRGYGFPMTDLIAEANLGLVTALNHFDPKRGARFSTCAIWWIRSAILDYVLRSWSLVRLGRTPAQKKLFFRLRAEVQRLQPDRHGAMTRALAEEISETLNVSVDDVYEMDQRLRGDLSLNSQSSIAGDTTEWQDLIIDDSPTVEVRLGSEQEQAWQRKALQDALAILDPRERQIFMARHLREAPASFETIGRNLLISAERVRQIDARAYSKVVAAARKMSSPRKATSATEHAGHWRH